MRIIGDVFDHRSYYPRVFVVENNGLADWIFITKYFLRGPFTNNECFGLIKGFLGVSINDREIPKAEQIGISE